MQLPEIVKQFIIKYVNSVDQLEILLLLKAHDQTDWTAEAVARTLFTNPDVAGTRLSEMAAQELLSEKKTSGPSSYRYCPRTTELQEAVSELAAAYPKFRVSVINLIFSKPIDKIRTFADAFRFKREEE